MRKQEKKTMTCPICGRLYCDHLPAERGQTYEEMVEDMYAPHLINDHGLTERVNKAEYEVRTGRKWKTNGERGKKKKR